MFGDAEAVGCNSKTVAGILHFKAYAVLLVTLFVVIFVIGVEIVVTLQILHERLVGDSPCATLGITLAYDRPTEEYAVAS